jgi:predicted deacylase
MAIEPLVGLTEDSVDSHIQGIFNVMMHLGMIEGTPKVPEKYTRLIGYVIVRPKNSGMFKSYVKIGDRVKKDQHIATVYNIFGDEIESINCPADGIISLMHIYPFINAGEYECYAFEIFFPELPKM